MSLLSFLTRKDVITSVITGAILVGADLASTALHREEGYRKRDEELNEPAEETIEEDDVVDGEVVDESENN